ncbi:hypothetical protein ACSV5K_25505 [Agrobacterium pusense]|uniref:hypothetical protein n=1 Tax=Agrobacterium pusense TaxID=648995 RepID=UPI003FD362D3
MYESYLRRDEVNTAVTATKSKRFFPRTSTQLGFGLPKNSATTLTARMRQLLPLRGWRESSYSDGPEGALMPKNHRDIALQTPAQNRERIL